MRLRSKTAALIIIVNIFACIWSQSALAGDSPDKWKYSRDINLEGNNKYKALFLDAAVYRHASKDLQDLRVVDREKGEFVPYYTLNKWTSETKEDITYQASLINRFNKDNNTWLDFKVIPYKENADVIGNRLVLDIPQENFVKNVELYGSFDGVEWTHITKESIYRVENVKKTDIKLGKESRCTYYRVMIPNNLEGITVRGLQVFNEMKAEVESGFSGSGALKYDIKTEGRTSFIVIHNDDRMRLDKIKLEIQGNFNRHYEVLAGEEDKAAYFLAAGELYNLWFKDLKITGTTIEFKNAPLADETITIKVDNKDDKPLDIKSINGEYQIDKLVFEARPNSSYTLYYGNAEAIRPSYDIESYRAHVEKESQDTCSLEAAKGNENKQSEPDYNLIFNVVMVVLSIMLIVFIIRKLNYKGSGSDKRN